MHENFYHTVKVYYEDTDAGGVVYYANYLKYLERARTEALTSIGLSNLKIKEKFDALIIVKSCNIEFKKSARLEDELKIRSFIKSITKTSFFMNQFITKNEDAIVESQVHLVFVNEKGKPVKVPDLIFDNFKPYFCDSIKLDNLNKTIVKCKKCPRLTNFIKKISKEKRKQNLHDKYWGKPVTGFGNSDAKLLILGLAPAAHGGTRTGRAFTGDKSGDFLFKCLHKAKISNQSHSISLNDGLRLKSTYVTNILKCVPPGDKPNNQELNNCSKYFDIEISSLKKLKTIVTLGKVSFDNCVKFL